jgi:hypothetical protein
MAWFAGLVVVFDMLGRLLGTPVEEVPPECRTMRKVMPAARASKPSATNSTMVRDPRRPAVVRVVGEAAY